MTSLLKLSKVIKGVKRRKGDRTEFEFFIKFHSKNINRLLIGNLNINSISNKFDGKVDILVVTETKLDSNFPNSQFLIGYSEPYRFKETGTGVRFLFMFEKSHQVNF